MPRCTPEANILIFPWFSNDFKVTFEPSWGHVGSILAHLGPLWGSVGPSWVLLGPTLIGKIGFQLTSKFKKGVLGATLRHPGALLGGKRV